MAVVQAERPGPSRFILPILGLIAVGLCLGGLLVLLDPKGGPNLLASIYDALGNTSGADDLRNGQGDQLIAKLILAAIAQAVGVGGIWLLFLGVGGLVSQLEPKYPTGSCRGSSSAPPWRCWRSSWSIPRRERSSAACRTKPATSPSPTSRSCSSPSSLRSCATTFSGWSLGPLGASCSGSCSRDSSIASDASPW